MPVLVSHRRPSSPALKAGTGKSGSSSETDPACEFDTPRLSMMMASSNSPSEMRKFMVSAFIDRLPMRDELSLATLDGTNRPPRGVLAFFR